MLTRSTLATRHEQVVGATLRMQWEALGDEEAQEVLQTASPPREATLSRGRGWCRGWGSGRSRCVSVAGAVAEGARGAPAAERHADEPPRRRRGRLHRLVRRRAQMTTFASVGG